MTWGQWLIPKLSLNEELEVRRMELTLAELVKQDPATAANLAKQLIRSLALHRNVLKQATTRIAELERNEALGDSGIDRWLQMAAQLQPKQARGGKG